MPPAAVYERPRALTRALSLLEEPGAVVLCGGTDFYPERLYQPRRELVVDVSRVEGLVGIERTADGWRFGAATTWAEVRDAALGPAFDGLREAARQVGATQIQNAGTVGGNLCTASPAGDGVPPLLTLQARVELQSARGVRVLPLEEFITGYRSTALAPGELVTAILMPDVDPRARGSFVKFGLRSHLVISVVMVAVVVVADEGTIVGARVAVGACSPVASRLGSVEAALVGCALADGDVRVALADVELDELTPIDDVRASSSFRARVVRELVADAVLAATP